MRLLFLGDAKPGTYISELEIHKGQEERRNIFLNTQSWPRNITVAYMHVSHTFQPGDIVSLHLEISLTPTFLCILPQLQLRGTYTSLRNPFELKWRNIHEVFHPGWLVCTDPWVVGGFDENSYSRYVAFCIDHRLSCDGYVNCPASSTADTSQIIEGNPGGSADERSRNLVCYAPSVNWLLIAIALFAVVNIGLLFLISYIGFLRRYSPLRFLHLQSSCVRYGCCCLPAAWRSQAVGNFPLYRRNSVSSNDGELPWSPPTYESVQLADSLNRVEGKNADMPKGRKPEAFAESSHNLPPSYVDGIEEIGVMPEGVIKKMQNLRNPPSRFRGLRMNSPHSKPFPDRIHRISCVNTRQIRQDLRVAMRRTRALIRSGFRVTRLRPNNQIHATPTPITTSVRQESNMDPNANENPSSPTPGPPLPDYFEFISGEYPRHPITVELDYPASDPAIFHPSTRSSRRQRSSHSYRRRGQLRQRPRRQDPRR